VKFYPTISTFLKLLVISHLLETPLKPNLLKLSSASALALALAFAFSPAYAVSVRWPAENIEIDVQFDVQKHTLSGLARLTIPAKGLKSAGFLLNKKFTVESAAIGGEALVLTRVEDFDTTEVTSVYGLYGRWNPSDAAFYVGKLSKNQLKVKTPVILEVRYTGELHVPPDKRQFSRDRIAFEVNGAIGIEGIYLSGGAFWYPLLPDCPTPYSLTARLPKGWQCVTDGVGSVTKQTPEYDQITYTSQIPTTGLNFAAGPFQVSSVQLDKITIQAYFLPAEADLAPGYLKAARKFILMYSNLIGPYPFSKFAIVDNFLPTGYGMPGWTALGSEVIRLPFIKDISLGHEILHNWFGNSLLVDYRYGNWCEGLTAYLADYKYKADIDSLAAMDYRMNLMRDYADLVSAEGDYPLADFTERSNPGDRAIGYGKGMMVFHMLRNIMNMQDTTLFIDMLKYVYKQNAFKRPISWKTWREAAEQRIGQPLDWFFEQWIEWKGVPEIAIREARLELERGSWRLIMEIVTKSDARRSYMYFLPVRGFSDEGRVDYNVYIRESPQRVIVGGPGNLELVQLDPDFHLFRKIYSSEKPLTLAAFFGDKNGLLVVPTQGMLAAAYRQAAEGLKSEGQKVITDDEYLTLDGEPKSLWIFGSPEDNKLWNSFSLPTEKFEWLPGRAARWKEDKSIPAGFNFRKEMFRGSAHTATLIAWHPKAEGEKCIIFSIALPNADPIQGTRKISHYGKYSYLLFEGENNIQKGAWPAAGQSPMVWQP